MQPQIPPQVQPQMQPPPQQQQQHQRQHARILSRPAGGASMRLAQVAANPLLPRWSPTLYLRFRVDLDETQIRKQVDALVFGHQLFGRQGRQLDLNILPLFSKTHAAVLGFKGDGAAADRFVQRFKESDMWEYVGPHVDSKRRVQVMEVEKADSEAARRGAKVLVGFNAAGYILSNKAATLQDVIHTVASVTGMRLRETEVVVIPPEHFEDGGGGGGGVLGAYLYFRDAQTASAAINALRAKDYPASTERAQIGMIGYRNA